MGFGFTDKIQNTASDLLSKTTRDGAISNFAKGKIDGAFNNFKSSSDKGDESFEYMKDSQWIKQSFIVTQGNLDDIEIANRKFSSAAFKYTDSSLGGNHCINPPPQFTRYADIRDKGLLRNAVDTTLQYQPGHIGMGRYYSEAIDDNSQVIHLRFGVPSYNSLTQFFTGFYNSSAAGLARTGRLDASFIEKFLRFGVGLVTLAIMPLLILPIAFMMAGNAFRFFFKMPSSKFYYLKPSMPSCVILSIIQ